MNLNYSISLSFNVPITKVGIEKENDSQITVRINYNSICDSYQAVYSTKRKEKKKTQEKETKTKR